MIDSTDRERVRASNPLEIVIQEYLPLLPDGRNLKALCPFHREKTPSFKVDVASGFYRCYGCGERGDVFSFMMKMEHIEFRDALELLAERAGIQLTRGPSTAGRAGGVSPRSAGSRRAALDLVARAQRWFQAALASSAGSGARDYLAGRGFRPETVHAFGLGLAPPGWTQFRDELRGSATAIEQAIEVGLLKRNPEGRVYDAFRDRIMFPIRNLQGAVIGFGGRSLAVNGEAHDKYINSSESALFKKGNVLYGLFEGRDKIRQGRHVLLMEGYTDVMMAHQVGLLDAVAVLGTALTEQNAEQVCRHADRITLVFDGDAAGVRAALRAVGVFLERAVDVRVVVLEGGLDPGDLLRTNEGLERFQATTGKAQDALVFLLGELARSVGTESGARKERLLLAFFPYYQRLQSEVRREDALRLVSETLQTPASRVASDLARLMASATAREAARPKPEVKRGELPDRRAEEEALVRALLVLGVRGGVLLRVHPVTEFGDSALREIARLSQEKTGGLQAGDIEKPEAKSRFLELMESLHDREREEESALRLLHELVVDRLERRSRDLRAEFDDSRSSRMGERRSEDLLASQQTLRRKLDRLRAPACRDWQVLEAMVDELAEAQPVGAHPRQ